MKRLCEGGTLVAITSVATIAIAAWSVLHGAESTVVRAEVRHYLEPARATVGVAPRRIDLAPAPLVAAGESQPLPAATPILPSLGNAGLIVTVSAGESVRSLTVDEWRELGPVFGARTYEYARIASCETGINPAFHGIDKDGDEIAGAFSVKPRLHGAVPVGLRAQALQVLDIEARAEAQGVPDPWLSTRAGCTWWNR